jgi:hypothetical protein
MFVQVIQGHVSDGAELRASADRWVREVSPGSIGWLGSTLGVTADGMAIAVVRFESEESARRNSDRPEQHQWWMETAKLFADIAFHDCREVYPFGAGGTDAAGFVQVMQGRYTDTQRALELLRRSEEPLRQLRPDVFGGLLCLHGDGGFTQAMYFTSEAEARIGEQKEPPPEVKELLEEDASLTQDLRFYDITDPVLVSPK